jgi:hypothetical protein
MRTEKDVEAYLLRLNRRFRTVEGQPGTFLVESAGDRPPMAIRVEPPLVVLRVQVGEWAAAGDPGALFKYLLELNAKQLLHTHYGLDDGHVVLSSALELENLDFNELQATLDEIDMALAQKLPGMCSKHT